MHADIYGSASTIIKNPEAKIVPDTTLMQAAIATVCFRQFTLWIRCAVLSRKLIYETTLRFKRCDTDLLGAREFGFIDNGQ